MVATYGQFILNLNNSKKDFSNISSSVTLATFQLLDIASDWLPIGQNISINVESSLVQP